MWLGISNRAPTRLFLVLVFLTSQSCSQSQQLGSAPVGSENSPSPPPQANDYVLVFSDEFDRLNLSPNGSGAYTWYDGLWWEKPVPAAHVMVANGILTLRWSRGQKPDATSVTTFSRDGRHYKGWRYGYFEVRMRWETVPGAWPAIWMLPVQHFQDRATHVGELDIFEGQGSTSRVFYGTIHEWKQRQDVRNNKPWNHYRLPAGVDLAHFHTYGLLWQPGRVTWYFDDQALFSAATYSIFDEQDYYLILASQEGVNWKYGDLQGVGASQIGVQVDWVRVWQK
jgi:beta-glucanase (GH16 family)